MLSAVVDSKAPVVTEDQFLRQVVGLFANEGRMPNVLIRVPAMYRDTSDVVRVRQAFRADLQALVDKRLSTADRKRIYASADRIVLVPRTAEDGSVKFQYIPVSLEAALAHAMRLLMDPAKALREDLKQCQWRNCNRLDDRRIPNVRNFFFVSERREAAKAAGKERTGKLPDRYCCEEHMRAEHRARATDATLQRRKEQREQKLRLAMARTAKAKVR